MAKELYSQKQIKALKAFIEATDTAMNEYRNAVERAARRLAALRERAEREYGRALK